MFHLNLSASGKGSRTEGRKSNKAFMILSALGILFVVDVHLGNTLSVLTGISPMIPSLCPCLPLYRAISSKNPIVKI